MGVDGIKKMAAPRSPFCTASPLKWHIFFLNKNKENEVAFSKNSINVKIFYSENQNHQKRFEEYCS